MISSADLMNLEFMDSDFGEGQFFCAEGIVARVDDPENRCRIQCVLPIFNEEEIYPIWARRIQLHVGAPGYGDYFVPEPGAEVMLQGRFGDTNNLFYAPLYNEDHLPARDFPDPTVAGIRFQGDLKFIADLDMQLRAKRLAIETEGQINIVAVGGLWVNGRKI
jgi:hypothetical protein